MKQTHSLKCAPEPFNDLIDGVKVAEFRKNDRDFQVGDLLFLREWQIDSGYTGRILTVVISHIQTGFGIPDGYVVLSVRRLAVSGSNLKPPIQFSEGIMASVIESGRHELRQILKKFENRNYGPIAQQAPERAGVWANTKPLNYEFKKPDCSEGGHAD